MYVDDFYAFVKQIHHEIHRRPAKQSPICCTIRYVYGCCSCLVARVICFSCTSSLCLFILCVRMQVAQSTFFIFILGDLYSSGVSVCVPFECDACVRACLRFIRLLTIRNITNGAKVTAFVHHCIATIFASLYASACVRISGCFFSISFTRTRFLSSFGSPLVRHTHTLPTIKLIHIC